MYPALRTLKLLRYSISEISGMTKDPGPHVTGISVKVMSLLQRKSLRYMLFALLAMS